MAWNEIFTKRVDGHAVVVHKTYIQHKPVYSVRFSSDKNGQLSPFFPFESVKPQLLVDLHAMAAEAITADKAKDEKLEADRIAQLAGKRSQVSASPREKNKYGPRATGKTAKKKAKLAARAEAAKQANAG